MRIRYLYSIHFPPHSERKVLDELAHHLQATVEGTTITYESSTAALFDIIRGWCYGNDIPLEAWYYDISLPLDKYCRMEMKWWGICDDFNLHEEAIDSLLTNKEDMQ